MAQHQVTLTDDAEEYVRAQIATGRFTSVAEVLADALEQARVRASQARLGDLIREGLECEGEDIEFTDEWWEQRMDVVKAAAERRRSA